MNEYEICIDGETYEIYTKDINLNNVEGFFQCEIRGIPGCKIPGKVQMNKDKISFYQKIE